MSLVLACGQSARRNFTGFLFRPSVVSAAFARVGAGGVWRHSMECVLGGSWCQSHPAKSMAREEKNPAPALARYRLGTCLTGGSVQNQRADEVPAKGIGAPDRYSLRREGDLAAPVSKWSALRTSSGRARQGRARCRQFMLQHNPCCKFRFREEMEGRKRARRTKGKGCLDAPSVQRSVRRACRNQSAAA